jgi:hypothetical protein
MNNDVPQHSRSSNGHHRGSTVLSSEYEDINLMDIKLLTLPTMFDHTKKQLEHADAVLRDILVDTQVQIRKSDVLFENRTELQLTEPVPVCEPISQAQAHTPRTTPLKRRAQYLTTLPYYENNIEILVPSIKALIQMHGVATVDTTAVIDDSLQQVQDSLDPHHQQQQQAGCRHCNSEEIMQSRKLAELTAWRIAFMGQISKKLGEP